jgi:hypothetical protein
LRNTRAFSAYGVTRALQVNASQNFWATNNIVLLISELSVPEQIMVTFFAVGAAGALSHAQLTASSLLEVLGLSEPARRNFGYLL